MINATSIVCSCFCVCIAHSVFFPVRGWEHNEPVWHSCLLISRMAKRYIDEVLDLGGNAAACQQLEVYKVVQVINIWFWCCVLSVVARCNYCSPSAFIFVYFDWCRSCRTMKITVRRARVPHLILATTRPHQVAQLITWPCRQFRFWHAPCVGRLQTRSLSFFCFVSCVRWCPGIVSNCFVCTSTVQQFV